MLSIGEVISDVYPQLLDTYGNEDLASAVMSMVIDRLLDQLPQENRELTWALED